MTDGERCKFLRELYRKAKAILDTELAGPKDN